MTPGVPPNTSVKITYIHIYALLLKRVQSSVKRSGELEGTSDVLCYSYHLMVAWYDNGSKSSIYSDKWVPRFGFIHRLFGSVQMEKTKPCQWTWTELCTRLNFKNLEMKVQSVQMEKTKPCQWTWTELCTRLNFKNLEMKGHIQFYPFNRGLSFSPLST